MNESLRDPCVLFAEVSEAGPGRDERCSTQCGNIIRHWKSHCVRHGVSLQTPQSLQSEEPGLDISYEHTSSPSSSRKWSRSQRPLCQQVRRWCGETRHPSAIKEATFLPFTKSHSINSFSLSQIKISSELQLYFLLSRGGMGGNQIETANY
jgi:hypothetical protein